MSDKDKLNYNCYALNEFFSAIWKNSPDGATSRVAISTPDKKKWLFCVGDEYDVKISNKKGNNYWIDIQNFGTSDYHYFDDMLQSVTPDDSLSFSPTYMYDNQWYSNIIGIDIDFKTGEKKDNLLDVKTSILNFGIIPQYIVSSGRPTGGWHIYYVLDDVYEIDHVRSISDGFKDVLPNVDVLPYKRYLLRVPYSYNNKYNPSRLTELWKNDVWDGVSKYQSYNNLSYSSTYELVKFEQLFNLLGSKRRDSKSKKTRKSPKKSPTKSPKKSAKKSTRKSTRKPAPDIILNYTTDDKESEFKRFKQLLNYDKKLQRIYNNTKEISDTSKDSHALAAYLFYKEFTAGMVLEILQKWQYSVYHSNRKDYKTMSSQQVILESERRLRNHILPAAKKDTDLWHKTHYIKHLIRNGNKHKLSKIRGKFIAEYKCKNDEFIRVIDHLEKDLTDIEITDQYNKKGRKHKSIRLLPKGSCH